MDADDLAKSLAAFPIVVVRDPQPATTADTTATPAPAPTTSDGSTPSGPTPLTVALLGETIYSLAPEFILFSEREGMLPNEIELDEANAPTGPGAVAASNYLYAAEIDLPKMLAADRRTRESFLLKANSKLTKAFNSFWSQTIGKGTQLSLTCDIEYHEASDAAKAGKPYLVFWISDGHTQLYPSQRSQGVRWFVSFFLQLKAAKREYHSVWFLLDEPGANLHSKAQADVLKLINDLRHEIPIVYSTHSPI
ncbi:ATP-binding protein [Paraburkholderia azotifigens]|nr:ATP-binding protein [Paraburkholderia azotifigens]